MVQISGCNINVNCILDSGPGSGHAITRTVPNDRKSPSVITVIFFLASVFRHYLNLSLIVHDHFSDCLDTYFGSML